MTTIQIKHRNTGAVLYECEAPDGMESGLLMRHALEKAAAAKADLRGADVLGASMRWFTPQAEAESRARVFDSMANNPCMCDEVREVYRQRAHDIRRAADEGVPA